MNSQADVEAIAPATLPSNGAHYDRCQHCLTIPAAASDDTQPTDGQPQPQRAAKQQ